MRARLAMVSLDCSGSGWSLSHTPPNWRSSSPILISKECQLALPRDECLCLLTQWEMDPTVSIVSSFKKPAYHWLPYANHLHLKPAVELYHAVTPVMNG